jgi:hypothetical protein
VVAEAAVAVVVLSLLTILIAYVDDRRAKTAKMFILII